MLGLSLGLSQTARRKQMNAENITALNAVAAGQSLMDYEFTQYSAAGRDAFILEAEQYFSEVSYIDGATGSSAAHKDATGDTNYWIDPDNTSDHGAAFDEFYTQIDASFDHRTDVNTIIWAQGDKDAIAMNSATLSKAQYKAALEAIFADMRAECGAIKIVISKIHRRVSGGRSAGYQAVRDVQEELILEYSDVCFGCEFYDQEIADAVHVDELGFVTKGLREARGVAVAHGKAAYLWPILSNVSVTADKVDFEITNTNGTDIVAPATTYGWRVLDDGVSVTVNAVTRTGTRAGQLDLASSPAAGSSISVDVWYGDQAGTVGATFPTVLMDNYVLAPSYDAALILNNINIYIDPRDSVKTYASGALVQDIACMVGSRKLVAASGLEFEYDESAFDGRGGLVVPDATTLMMTDSDFTAGGVHTFIAVLEFPATPANGTIFGLGTSSQVNAYARLMTNAYSMNWGRNAANSFEVIQAGIDGQRAIIVLQSADTDDMTGYFNSLRATKATFDPHDTLSNAAQVRFGMGSFNGTDGITGLTFGTVIHTTENLSVLELSSIIRKLNKEYSVGLEDDLPIRAQTFQLVNDSTAAISSVPDFEFSYGESVSEDVSGYASGSNLVYSISGSAFLSINSSTGVITGTAPSEDTTETGIEVTVTNAAGSASDMFDIGVVEGGVFDPRTNEALSIWYSSRDTGSITQSAGLVSALEEKVSGVYNAVQAVGASQPVTGATSVNGLNVIDFDGGNDFLTVNNVPFEASTTLMFVGAVDGISNANAAAFSLDSARDFQLSAAAGLSYYAELASTGIGTIDPLSSPSDLLGEFSIIILRMNALTGTIELIINGTVIDTASGYNGDLSPLQTLNIFTNRAKTQNPEGRFGEFMVIDEAMSNESLNYMGEGLAEIWGLTWIVMV